MEHAVLIHFSTLLFNWWHYEADRDIKYTYVILMQVNAYHEKNNARHFDDSLSRTFLLLHSQCCTFSNAYYIVALHWYDPLFLRPNKSCTNALRSNHWEIMWTCDCSFHCWSLAWTLLWQWFLTQWVKGTSPFT